MLSPSNEYVGDVGNVAVVYRNSSLNELSFIAKNLIVTMVYYKNNKKLKPSETDSTAYNTLNFAGVRHSF